MAKKISCLQQKGGVGKTTLNVLLTNYIAYTTGKKVLLLDCDQNKSLTGLRQLDIAAGHTIEEMYDFESIPAIELPNCIDVLDNAYDYIIFDMPGTIHETGILSTYIILDHIFVPVILSKTEIQPTYNFYEFISNGLPKLKENLNLPAPTILGVHNRIDLRNNDDKLFVQNGITPYSKIPSLTSYVPAAQYLKTNLNTAGLFENCPKKLKDELSIFCKEALKIINKK